MHDPVCTYKCTHTNHIYTIHVLVLLYLIVLHKKTTIKKLLLRIRKIFNVYNFIIQQTKQKVLKEKRLIQSKYPFTL